ncbi:MAG: CBS domain-containing protein [Acidobacteria bacterium]|nr:MAG: CBS domain-containing protein [Acidobacteriota bacterium]
MTVSTLIESRGEVFSIAEATTVHAAARYLREKQVRAVAVCDGHEKVVGVVSQSDISDKVAAENKYPEQVCASEIMSTRLVAVSPQESIEECFELMEKYGIYHLLVIAEGGSYRGMISTQDLLKVIAFQNKALADCLEDYIVGRR